ncbi:MAG: TatD family hydrolase [Granulosicoccus sp.]|nr:TatD family hydrolase [Granulosicoccus sp.]
MNGPATASLVDSHVHTDDARLEVDRPEVLRAARAANVIAQIVPGISLRLWPRVKTLCADHPDLYPCYGLHPCYTHEHKSGHIEELALWLGREHPVAVGECGLDYQVAGADKALQQHLFSAQLSLAREFDLPIVIHARKAVEDVIRMIRSSGHYRGMVHSYNGSAQQATRLIDLGYKLSFGGAVTYDRARRLRELVAHLPLDALLLETDAPDQPDAQHVRMRNEPAFLVDVWRSVSALRKEDSATVAAATTRNAIELFHLSLATVPQSLATA